MATLLDDSKDWEGGEGTYSPANQTEMHSYNPANQLAIHFYSESITKRFIKLQITEVGIFYKYPVKGVRRRL